METLLSVGIDLGTTTTQMVVSRLQIENTANAFSVPRMEIKNRELVYQSAVYETPLLSSDTLDAAAIEKIIRREYTAAKITPDQVQTGAVIITGETARKENAKQVMEALSDLAGEFVVATAGPALESVLAAKGAGADLYARSEGCTVLHMDIGGGTSNLALFDCDGNLVDTGCLNVGGRLIKLDADGKVTYVSPLLQGVQHPEVGDRIEDPMELKPLLRQMVIALEQAAGRTVGTDELGVWITDKTVCLDRTIDCVSFSGGVADLIEGQPEHWLQYGDIGVLLGREIKNSALCKKRYWIGKETLRATVIGAGIHTTELSGSTIYYQNIEFPIQNLPVSSVVRWENLAEYLQHQVGLYGMMPVLSLNFEIGSYDELLQLAETVAAAFRSCTEAPILLVQGDMAKAVGQAVARRLGKTRPVLCLDGLHIPPGSYLDIQGSVGTGCAVTVIVKTLAFQSY